MDSEKIKNTLSAVLRDFARATDSYRPGRMVRLSSDDERLLPPYSIFLALVTFAGFPVGGRQAKVAWTIPIRYKSVGYNLAHEKLGFRIYAMEPENTTAELERSLIKRLASAVRISDRLAEPYVKEQLRLGNVTIANKYLFFRDMYQFLRKQAQETYSAPPPPRTVLATDARGNPTSWVENPLQREREGYFLACSSLDAYFSLLEHTLVLLLAFANFDPVRDKLDVFVKSNWGAKFKRVFDFRQDRDAQQVFDALLRLKEEVRNTVFHGGFERDGLSLQIHMPDLGAVPMSLSRYWDRIISTVDTGGNASFQHAWQVLDHTDTFFETGSARLAMKYIQSGLDVAFDERNRRRQMEAMESDNGMDAFIDRMAGLQDMWANMDW
jgi:hypothetical protein